MDEEFTCVAHFDKLNIKVKKNIKIKHQIKQQVIEYGCTQHAK